jgi:hypothetical protein
LTRIDEIVSRLALARDAEAAHHVVTDTSVIDHAEQAISAKRYLIFDYWGPGEPVASVTASRI